LFDSDNMATIASHQNDREKGAARRYISSIMNSAGNENSIRLLEIASFLLLITMGVFTFMLLTAKNTQTDPLSPIGAATLLVANLLPATALLVLFGRRLALRRAALTNLGTRQRLHVRLVAIFSLLAAIPTLLLVIFASLLFQSGVEFWFSGSARGMLENAGELAQGYYNENQQSVRQETATMSDDLRKILNQISIDDPAFFDAYLTQMFGRKLSESAIVSLRADKTQKTDFVLSSNDKAKNYQWINDELFKRLAAGEKVAVLTSAKKIEAATLLYDNPKTYLYTNRAETIPTFSLGSKAQSVLRDYRIMETRARSLQLQFNAALYFISLAIIAITVWVALLVADRLVRPVTNLVSAAQRISEGDLSARVHEDPDRLDEVSYLSQSFNRMTERLEDQTDILLTANRQLDDRRAFIETVLESVSAGIVSLDNSGVVQLANSKAQAILGTKETSIVGTKFAQIAPSFQELLMTGKPYAVLQLGSGSEPLTMAVTVVSDDHNKVVTFEDISQQLADQKRAAWSDVARRIAHEIKNPLTPIQLAAERLQRRFGSKITDEGKGVFNQLTDTIIRQVGDLRNIVDEFSSFARMPKPTFRDEDLIDILGHSIFLFQVAHPKIRFQFEHKEKSLNLICDRRQLGQAFTNILKNAVESIQEKINDEAFIEGCIKILVSSHNGAIKVTFEDNGQGLPLDRKRIIEPYVTNKTKGSGLGLAIVQKIIEEHFAEITFDDAPLHGAMISIMFKPR
jgi:two-component system, NtrC family, nitrogen regulation sensor histidine kinase NtrY